MIGKSVVVEALVNRYQKTALLILFSICSGLNLSATDKTYLDSIQQVLTRTNSIPEKIACLYTLSFEYGFIEPRKGIDYGFQCLKLAVENNDVFNQLNAYNGLGNCYETLADFDSARYCHTQSYLCARRLGSKKKIATALTNVAITYKEQGDYRNALNIYLEAFKILEGEKDYNPRIHYFIGEMYMALGDFDQAEYHSRRGIEKCKELDHTYVIHNLFINLAKCLHHQNKTDSAVILLRNSLHALKKNTDQLSVTICLKALGEIYAWNHDFKSALSCFTQELQLQHFLKNENGICLAYLNMARTYASIGNKNNSHVQVLLQESIGRLASIRKNKDMLRSTYLKIAETFEQINKPAEALQYFKLHYRLNDSLLSKEKFSELNELQTRYETEKKVKQIQLQKAALENQSLDLQRKKLQLLIVCASFLFICILGFLLYNRYRAKQKNLLLMEVQKQERLREIALKEKESQERERISRDIHDELGAGLSKIVLVAEYSRMQDQGQAESISTISVTAKELSENIRNLVWALNPNNNTLDNLVARIHEYVNEYFEDLPLAAEFDFPEDVPGFRISKEVQRNIFLSFKEATNNAIKHSGGTKINIALKIPQENLVIIVSDDGHGFEDRTVRKTGNGLRNMEQRILDIGGKFDIQSSIAGTTVTMQIEFDKLSV
jgi:signal transduction histidine kinase